MTIFFTSDSHWGHANVIKNCNRPFANVDEMDKGLIDRWNSVVTPKDTVYFIGDFAFYKDQQKTVDVINQLKGEEIHLILGNHDRNMKSWVRDKFTSVSSYKEIYVTDETCLNNEQFIVLCHYAMRVWNRSHRNSFNLYGHSHGSLPDDPKILSLDVGVDCWDYAPVSYERIKERMKLKTLQPIDHHGKRDL